MDGTLIILQLTPFCNINCSYCYLPNRSNKERISLDLLSQIFESVFSSKQVQDPINFAYHAGEPLVVSKDFYRQIFAKQKHINESFGRSMKQGIQTNGILIDREWASLFREFDIRVGVSVDGPDFVHDRNGVQRNGKPTHQKVMQGVRILQEEGIDFTVIAVLTAYSLDYADQIYKFFVENNIRYVGFNIDEFGANPHVSTYVSPNWEVTKLRYRRFMLRFMELVDRDNGKLIVREFAKISSILTKYAYGQKDIINGANVPFNIVSFDVKGNFATFCPELLNAQSPEYGDFIMGNVTRDHLDEMLRSEKFITINNQIQAGVTQCKETCSYWRFCGGGTPSNKYYELQTLNATETLNCRVHTKLLVDVMLEYLQKTVSS